MFSMVTIRAQNRKSAEALLRRAVELVDLDQAHPKLTGASETDAAVTGFTISVDDEQFPFLTEYDGDDFPFDLDVE